MTLWLVRAGEERFQEQDALTNNVITVGWNEVPDLSQVGNKAKFKLIYSKIRSAKSPGIWQLYDFVKAIRKGDLAAIPLQSNETAVSEVTGDYEYGKVSQNIKHFRRVKPWTIIPNKFIDKSILRSLGAGRTLGKVKRENAEKKTIQALKKGEPFSLEDYLRNNKKSNLSFEEAVQLVKKKYAPDSERSREEKEVIAKYGAIFKLEKLDMLTREAFESFLLIENNKHWNHIHRYKSRMTSHFDKLKDALRILLDESKPVSERLDMVIPEGKGMVPGFNKAVVTPILLVSHPEKYSVHNEIVEAGMRGYDVFPEIHEGSFGERYSIINEKIKGLASKYGLTLWEIDEVWRLGDNSVTPSADNQYFLVQVNEFGSKNLLEKKYYQHEGWKETPRDSDHGKVKVGDILAVYFASKAIDFQKQMRKLYKVDSITRGNVRFNVSEIKELAGLSLDKIRHAINEGRLGDVFKRISQQGFNISRLDKKDYEALVKLGKGKVIDGDGHGPGPIIYSFDELTSDTGLSPDKLRDIEHLLLEKRQLIFYGPPGTGKTFIAQKFALYLTQKKQNVRVVQFHQSYSYEDFVEGIKPNLSSSGDAVGFSKQKGALRILVDECLKNPDERFVMIIDEINRGNISKIFGELVYLLEYRDQKINLTYSPIDNFYLPNNLYIIGTMNSADRSIAFLDYALRRRFYFQELYPSTVILHQWLQQNTSANDLNIIAICTMLENINKIISDKLGQEYQIGQSYFMRDDLDVNSLRLVVDYAIMPLVSQYFFGNTASTRQIREICDGTITEFSK